MKIAIIGSGISGLTTAHLLHGDFDIHLFEANDYIGGHTNTVAVGNDHGSYMVDTGFIVFNETTYPNFCRLISNLGVQSQPTEMTFSVRSAKSGIEYNAHSLSTFFAQKKNLFFPSHYKMIFDIFRFRTQFDKLTAHKHDAKPLVPYLQKHGYGEQFINHFILPITASLWSAKPDKARNFPLGTFVRFFKKHGFLNIKNPFTWQVIKGGSKTYVEKITTQFKNKIHLSCPVLSIKRNENCVELKHKDGIEVFDHVVLAVHSDQARSMLEDPTDKENEILGAIGYQQNHVILHTDTSILPENQSIWASWNYFIPNKEQQSATLSYDMNILQDLTSPDEFLVSLNQQDFINSSKIIGKYLYHHPVYSPEVPAAQKRHAEISGIGRTHYCGAYWGYGFHEDGVNSGLAVCKHFGKKL